MSIRDNLKESPKYRDTCNQIIRNKELNLDELKEVFYALMKIIYILGLSIKPTILDKEDKELEMICGQVTNKIEGK